MVYYVFKSMDPMKVALEVVQKWRDAENSPAAPSLASAVAPGVAVAMPAAGRAASLPASVSSSPGLISHGAPAEKPVARCALDMSEDELMEEDSDVGLPDPWDEGPDGGPWLEAPVEARDQFSWRGLVV